MGSGSWRWITAAVTATLLVSEALFFADVSVGTLSRQTRTADVVGKASIDNIVMDELTSGEPLIGTSKIKSELSACGSQRIDEALVADGIPQLQRKLQITACAISMTASPCHRSIELLGWSGKATTAPAKPRAEFVEIEVQHRCYVEG